MSKDKKVTVSDGNVSYEINASVSEQWLERNPSFKIISKGSSPKKKAGRKS